MAILCQKIGAQRLFFVKLFFISIGIFVVLSHTILALIWAFKLAKLSCSIPENQVLVVNSRLIFLQFSIQMVRPPERAVATRFFILLLPGLIWPFTQIEVWHVHGGGGGGPGGGEPVPVPVSEDSNVIQFPGRGRGADHEEEIRKAS